MLYELLHYFSEVLLIFPYLHCSIVFQCLCIHNFREEHRINAYQALITCKIFHIYIKCTQIISWKESISDLLAYRALILIISKSNYFVFFTFFFFLQIFLQTVPMWVMLASKHHPSCKFFIMQTIKLHLFKLLIEDLLQLQHFFLITGVGVEFLPVVG